MNEQQHTADPCQPTIGYDLTKDEAIFEVDDETEQNEL